MIEPGAGPSFLARLGVLWFVGGLTIVLFTIMNLPWHLDDYDQAKQAFASFEMVKHGHWLYQHTPNAWVATKPPLGGWISAAFFFATRSWELAWRLPSFLAAIALLVLIHRAASAYGAVAALLAASAFGLNLFTLRLATLVRTDMLFALIVFLLGWQIWDKIRNRAAWTARDRFMSFLLLTAALLIKGPVVYAFLLPGILVFEWRTRSTPEPVTAWCGGWPWIASLVLFGAWVAGGIFFVPEFSEQVVTREFAGRFGQGWHRAQPIYFYIPHFFYRFAPWSILMLLLAAGAALAERPGLRARIRGISPETFWLIVWSCSGLLALSLVPSKRTDRVFPILPPLCLLLAAQISELQKKGRRDAALIYCQLALVLACVGFTCYATVKIFHRYGAHQDAFATFGNAIRKEAAAHSLRYAVIGGEDEGILLYLRSTEFIEPDEAVAQWKEGRLNGLVVPEDELNDLRPHLAGAVPSRIGTSGTAGNYHNRYIFLVRP